MNNTFPELKTADATENPADELKQKTELLETGKKDFSIVTKADYELAKDRLVTATKLLKEIHATFDPIVSKTNAAHKEATGQRKRHLDPVEAVKQFYSRLMGDYDMVQQRERKRLEDAENKKRQDAADDAAKETADKMESLGFKEEAEEIRTEGIEVAPIVIEKPKESGTHYRDNWQAEVVDFSKVPREYLLIDQSKINGMAKVIKGDSTIPGVRFVNHRKAVAR